jgi:hypothetical protein
MIILNKKLLVRRKPDNKIEGRNKASMTVEASLVLPLFILFMIAFVYFIQIITVQEQIQESITKTGMSLAKLAYVYDDFLDAEEAKNIDFTIFGEEYEIDLKELTGIVRRGGNQNTRKKGP